MNEPIPPDIIIRPALLPDASLIAQIHVRSWQHGYKGIVPQEILDNLSIEKAHAGWVQQLTEKPHAVLVSEAQGQVTGWAAFGPTRDADIDQQSTWEVFAIYFDPHAWGRGGSG